jgi:hypothetical protein
MVGELEGEEGGFKLSHTLNGFWRNDLSQHLFCWSAGVILIGAMRTPPVSFIIGAIRL